MEDPRGYLDMNSPPSNGGTIGNMSHHAHDPLHNVKIPRRAGCYLRARGERNKVLRTAAMDVLELEKSAALLIFATSNDSIN